MLYFMAKRYDVVGALVGLFSIKLAGLTTLSVDISI
jgi:hypothetical protein